MSNIPISGYYVGHLQEIVEQQRAEINRLRSERLAFATESEERKAEIERLTAQNANLRRWQALGKPLTAAMSIVVDDMQELRAEIERLKKIEAAAAKAYRYHMLGYKDPEDFNANVMLDLMNELGAVL